MAGKKLINMLYATKCPFKKVFTPLINYYSWTTLTVFPCHCNWNQFFFGRKYYKEYWGQCFGYQYISRVTFYYISINFWSISSQQGIAVITRRLTLARTQWTTPKTRVYAAATLCSRWSLFGKSTWWIHQDPRVSEQLPLEQWPDIICLFLHVVAIYTLWHRDLVVEHPMRVAKLPPAVSSESYSA